MDNLHEQTIEKLLERSRRRGMVLGLDSIRAALRALGDPHLGIPTVHIAGSNGKGSTSAMVEAIARRAGLRTGLYTSPHLCQLTELIRLDGEPIAEPLFDELANLALGAGAELTFFEVMTVLAFLAFQRARVDLAVVEVGLGGAEDATNVIVAPLATAITTVSMEHTRFLGSSLDAIARAKAGIIKPGAPAILGPLPPEADRAAAHVAESRGAASIWRVVRGDPGAPRSPGEITLTEENGAFTVSPPIDSSYSPIRASPGLKGPHQLANAAVSAAIAWCLARRWPAILSSMEAGISSARHPGRMERIHAGGATLFLDCAHNPEGALALRSAVREEGNDPERTVLVFGALADKDWRSMLATLAPCADRRVYTLPEGRAPAPLEDLMSAAEGRAIASPLEAVRAALEWAGDGGTVLVTGSIYLVGEVRGHLFGIRSDPVITY